MQTMTKWEGFSILPIQETISSTNTWLKEHAAVYPDRTVLIAKEQTNGRGRNERTFYSAKGKGLYLSILLKAHMQDLPFTKLTACSALALQRAIFENCQLQTQIKWVNDIIYQGHKLAGILCETLYEGNAPTAFIIGFGVNVFSQVFPKMENTPGALADFAPNMPCIDTLILSLLHHFALCLKEIHDPAIMEAYRQCSCVLQKEILVKERENSYPAIAYAIDDNGALLIQTKENKKILQSGEVSIRIQK